MNKLLPSLTSSLSNKERLYLIFGLVSLVFAGLMSTVEYGIAPLFTDQPWHPIPAVLLFLFWAGGVLLMWFATRNVLIHNIHRLDNILIPFLMYRLVRRLFLLVFTVVSSVFLFLFDEDGTDSSDESGSNPTAIEDPKNAWDMSPKHYYDKDPPPPFW